MLKDERSLLFGVEAVDFIHILFFEDIPGEGADNGGFEGWSWDATFGAGSAFAIGKSAEVGLIFVTCFLVGCATIER